MMDTATQGPRPRRRKQNFSAAAPFGSRAESNWYPSRSTTERSHTGVLEKMGTLFEPDILAPAQYFDNRRRKALLEPEKRLMLAILEDGINCFQDHILEESGKGKQLFEDAERWLLEEGGDWILSLIHI